MAWFNAAFSFGFVLGKLQIKKGSNSNKPGSPVQCSARRPSAQHHSPSTEAAAAAAAAVAAVAAVAAAAVAATWAVMLVGRLPAPKVPAEHSHRRPLQSVVS
jgi:predicted metal-binding membrane protein